MAARVALSLGKDLTPTTGLAVRSLRRTLSSQPSWATIDPKSLGTNPDIYAVPNFVNGEWKSAKSTIIIPHPMDRDAQPIFTVPDTQVEELEPFLASLRQVPKSGLHNPIKNPHRYVEYGEISRKVYSS